MIAKTQAVFIEIVFEPTVVPKEFATSFAPTAKARMKAIINDATTIFAALNKILEKFFDFFKSIKFGKKIIFIIKELTEAKSTDQKNRVAGLAL